MAALDELRTRIAELEAENERLEKRRNNLEYNEVVGLCDRYQAHIEDIAAHATPFGDIPGEPGWAGQYLLTAGALHRAMGTLGHTEPSCQAEAELAALNDRRCDTCCYCMACSSRVPTAGEDWPISMCSRWAERSGT
jgi:hypothetical protein